MISRYAAMDARAREKLAVALLTTFLLGWIAVCLAIQAWQAHHHGYGGGITNRGHLPDEIVERFGGTPGMTKEELMELTNR
ncbi:hypothetical protein [Sporichthya polymorpha]|uniref:hypothetical protein n=1 Tax=Sporichthya polymorpha TaxID=35751 RepID=UPI00035D6E6A|nr:hypothetical protein [Sporichthya polymorpha]